MNMRIVLLLYGLCCCFYPGDSAAQTSNRVSIVAILTLSAKPDNSIITTFVAGLRRLGYVDGQNLRIEFWTAGGQPERLQQLAEEIVRLKPDVIVTGGGPQVRAAAQATSTIPIVVLFHEADPTLSQVVASYRKPGGNVTGVDAREIEIVGKRLELVREVFPTVTQVAVLWNTYSRPELAQLERDAQSIGVQLHEIEVNSPFDFDNAFQNAKQRHIGAAMILLSPPFYVRREQLHTASMRAKVATIHQKEDMVRAGGLISY